MDQESWCRLQREKNQTFRYFLNIVFMSDLAFRSFTTTLHFMTGVVGGSRSGSNVNKPTCMVTRVHIIGFNYKWEILIRLQMFQHTLSFQGLTDYM